MEGTVRNAAAESPVDVEVSTEADPDAAELTGLSVTPAVDTSFTLDLVESPEPLDTSPDFEPGDGTTPLSYMSVEHSIGNANIEEVAITYRVDSESLEAMDSSPEDVSLYRHDGESWNEHPTQVVEMEDGDAILQTTAEGLSEWTAAAKRPRFNVTDTAVDVQAATTDEEITIQVFVANTGGTDGVYDAELLLNDETVDRVERTVPDGGTVALNFERTFDQPGLYEVQVNDVFVGEVNISAVEESVDVETASGDDGQLQAVEAADRQVADETPEAGGKSLPVLPLGLVLVFVAGLGVWGYLTRISE